MVRVLAIFTKRHRKERYFNKIGAALPDSCGCWGPHPHNAGIFTMSVSMKSSWMLVAAALFAIMGVLVKYASAHFSSPELVFIDPYSAW